MGATAQTLELVALGTDGNFCSPRLNLQFGMSAKSFVSDILLLIGLGSLYRYSESMNKLHILLLSSALCISHALAETSPQAAPKQELNAEFATMDEALEHVRKIPYLKDGQVVGYLKLDPNAKPASYYKNLKLHEVDTKVVNQEHQ